MSKLEQYIEQIREKISLIEEYETKGYTGFFECISGEKGIANQYRSFLNEYIIANVADFFEKNGVEYAEETNIEYNEENVSKCSVPVINAISNVKISKARIEYIGKEYGVCLKDGYLLEFPALLYAIETIPKMREIVEATFGKELISEEIFPDFTKLQKKMEKIIEISNTILERRKLESLSDEAVVQKSIQSSSEITNLNKEIEEIETKIELIKKAVEENGIYTLDNHPTYKKLLEEQANKKAEREAIIKGITESDPSVLREKLMPSTDYEAEYEKVKLLQKRESELAKEGITAEEAYKKLGSEYEQQKSELEELRESKKVIEWYSRQLEAINSLIESDEYSNFYSLLNERAGAHHYKQEKERSLEKVEKEKEVIEQAKKEYKELSFFGKKSSNGNILKAMISEESEVDKCVNHNKELLNKALIEEDAINEKFDDARDAYGQLFEQLNTDNILTTAIAVSKPEELFDLSQETLLMIRSNIQGLIKIDSEQLGITYKTSEEEMQSLISAYEAQEIELNELLDYQEANKQDDGLYHESLITAVNLIREDSAESNTGKVVYHKHK